MKNDMNERRKIIDQLDSNLFVRASAGSGKTTILVERLVALVEEGKVDLSQIAALTFTKKAANEFYERFYKKLTLRTKPDFKDEHSLLTKPNKEQVERDKEALNNIDSCFFGTIDAFYQKILNEHPLEAGVPSNVQIMDEEEFYNFLTHKFSDYLKSENLEIAEQAKDFSLYVGAKNFPKVMSVFFDNRKLQFENLHEDLDFLENAYENALNTFKKGTKILIEHENELRLRRIKDDIEVDQNNDSKASWEYLHEKIGAIQNLKHDDYLGAQRIGFKKLNNLLFSNQHDDLFINDNVLSTNTFHIPYVNRNKQIGYCVSDYLNTLLQKIIFLKSFPLIINVLPDIRESLLKAGKITFNEATLCILDLLRNPQYSETVRHIRQKYTRLLIDECQDTDINQYEIFFRLTANNNGNKLEDFDIDGGKLFCVGDRKQSIYHFRGADVSVFDLITKIFETKKANGLPFEIINLTDNYRSKGKVIQYFNNSFNKVLASQGYKSIPNDQIKEGEEHFGAFYYESTKETDPEEVTKIIRFMISNYGYSFKDFMIITSNKKNISSYAKKIALEGIPCYEEGNIDFNISPLLNSILALFKYLASNKKDKISLLEFLTSDLFKFDAKKTINLKEDYLKLLDLPECNFKYPSLLLESLSQNTTVLKVLNCNGIDILIGLIHLIRIEEASGVISSFDDAIKYLNKLQTGESEIERMTLLSNKIDAVQIANQHKTKGLEKKIVIATYAGNNASSVSYLKRDGKFYIIKLEGDSNTPYKPVLVENPNSDIPPLSDYIIDEKDYLVKEKQRLLYVVATRAREFLFVARSTKRATIWKDIDEFTLPSPTINNENIPIKPLKSIFLDDKINLKINKTFNREQTLKIISPSLLDSNKFEEDIDLQNKVHGKNNALLYGTIVHKLMEIIISCKEKELDDCVCDFICDQYDANEFKAKLINLKNKIYNGGCLQDSCPFNDILDKARQSISYTEVPFSYKNNNEIINGQIDLVLENDDGFIMLDYKTDIVDRNHNEQLNAYKNILLRKYPNAKIETFIYKINI